MSRRSNSPDAPARVSLAGSGETFPPLRADEPTDVHAAGRLLNYCGLIDGIANRLLAESSWDTEGMRASGFGRYLRVHERFALYLGVSFTAWRNHGVTPLWCRCFGVEGWEREVQESFEDAIVDDEGYPIIPVRLMTGVERRRVIDHAAEQMRKIAGHLLEMDMGDRRKPASWS